MASFTVEEVSTREQLDGIADCIWAVMDSDSVHKVFYPVLYDRETALRECKEHLWAAHVDSAVSQWIFVRDPAVKPLRVLGACQWRIYEQNPFSNGMPDVTATWWPKGEERDFATEFVRQCIAPRVKWMARPHSELSWCVVLPDHQRQGIGQTLMSWGLERTDGLGIESYIEATPAGRKLYERTGFRFVARVDINTEKYESGDGWKTLQSGILPFGYDAMWRAVHGVWKDGEPQRTWAERLGAEEGS
ncbi:MAG: hypothetical protein M1820_007579 [Bogoriella megaspora]|nr:MAG: hypothetical protein M1820_007579 [Bogoriella megaspora]